jgi:CBS domain-containing protein
MQDRLALLLKAAERLTVDLIAQEPVCVRVSTDTPGYARHVADSEGFDVLPVVEEDGRIVRYVTREDLDRHPSATEWDAIDLTDIHPDEIVSSASPMFDLLSRFSHDQPRLFVLSRGGIDGIATVYDLNQPAAHQFAFALCLVVESELGRSIEIHAASQLLAETAPDATLDLTVDRRIKEWIGDLPSESFGAAKTKAAAWEKKVARGDQVRLTRELVFHDKIGLIEHGGLAALLAAQCRPPDGVSGMSAEQLLASLRGEVKELRNALAHDRGELVDEWRIWRWMQTTFALAQDLSPELATPS